jgi:hypothetical protein
VEDRSMASMEGRRDACRDDSSGDRRRVSEPSFRGALRPPDNRV